MFPAKFELDVVQAGEEIVVVVLIVKLTTEAFA
jgi:hypothetical protein